MGQRSSRGRRMAHKRRQPDIGKTLHRERRTIGRLVQAGRTEEAAARLQHLLAQDFVEGPLRAEIRSDLAAVLAVQGNITDARAHLLQALEIDPESDAAQRNLALLGGGPQSRSLNGTATTGTAARGRIAIVGMLFNWVTQATGGGCTYTVGLGQALSREGYQVRHFYARSAGLGLGKVETSYPLAGEAIDVDGCGRRIDEIKDCFRRVVDRFAPDLVIVTDTWNSKPHLVDAIRDYPVLVRFDSQECLCPLNNCRWLWEGQGSFRQCPSHQLATPQACEECLVQRAHMSGSLHRAERELSGVGTPAYLDLLYRSLEGAEAVIVNNPIIAECLKPYAREVSVIPAAVEASRFDWTDEGGPERAPEKPKVIFMAGAIEEHFKGFPTLHRACQLLWERRRDFRLVATGQVPGRRDEFTEFTGWLSQDVLPTYYRQADICVVPCWMQDAWPTVAVEAMAAGRPLVASSIGGLQLLVSHGATGLLYRPGDPVGIAQALNLLLDDQELRCAMGRQARARFEKQGSWDALIEQRYRPLLARVLAAHRGAAQ